MGLSWRNASTVVPAVLLVGGAAYGVTAWGYGLGSGAQPGPGLFPFAIAVALVLSAAVWLVTEARRTPAGQEQPLPFVPFVAGVEPALASSVTHAEEAGPDDDDRLSWGRVAGVALAGTLVIPLSTWIGLIAATGVLVGVAALLMRARAVTAVAIGVVFAVLAYLLFEQWLGVPLPDGFLLTMGIDL